MSGVNDWIAEMEAIANKFKLHIERIEKIDTSLGKCVVTAFMMGPNIIVVMSRFDDGYHVRIICFDGPSISNAYTEDFWSDIDNIATNIENRILGARVLAA